MAMEIRHPKRLHIHSLPIVIIAIILVILSTIILTSQTTTSVNGQQLLQALFHRTLTKQDSDGLNPPSVNQIPETFMQAGQTAREVMTL